MSIDIGKKIREIREAEGLTREEFGAMLDIPAGSIKRYETGRIEKIGGIVLLKIAGHPQFEKYTTWLMNGKTNESAGQVSPALSPDGQDSRSSRRNAKQAG
ncbi:helix-turn-helix transcriptional regulator [Salmonella enterica]|nr:XRE family transcriptional regulator [Salmonella enterica]ECC3210113.1 XRE family transcriptional regulator [Salmonella enterica subsp. diarizonae]EDQ3620709.1 helix-turn-helix transcriptional regulator [Salmonella enterica subsp. diarizonae]EDQ9399630.1 helix-turn-helix transcriptional regulator [Salmonella enterica]EDR4377627.1 helix-turn-helix transcriptional regulator [Salmonella enterica]